MKRINYSIQVNKGTWYVYFRLSTADGQRKQKCLSTGISAGSNGKKNRRAAEAIASEIVEKYEDISYSSKAEMLLGDYMLDWLNRRRYELQSSTYLGDMTIVNHISRYFGERKIKVKDIKPMLIQQYINDKLSNGLGGNTVGKHLALLKTALSDAVRNEIIQTNPSQHIKKPPKIKPQYNFYTPEQLKELVEVVSNTDMEMPIMLAIFFALRRSEVLGLKWSTAIDLEKQTLTVQEKITRTKDDNGKLHDTPSEILKTKTSYQRYQFNDMVCNYLLRKKTEQEQMFRETDAYKDYLCVDSVGNLLKLDAVSRKFKEILRKNDLPPIRFHDLRHSCLSILANCQIPLKAVQEYGRHATITTTANTYSHIYADTKLSELNVICASLGMGELK